VSEATIAVIERLVDRFPALRQPFAEHLSGNFGEILPHVFLSIDVVLYANRLFLGSTREADERDRQIADTELQALLAAIEQEYVEGDVEVRNLIFVSFLESLPTPGEEAYLLRTRLGPHLAKALEQLWRPHPAT
jgi:hypothetical protein